MNEQRPSPLRLGITGGIGSGKSYVARLLCHHYGFCLYDSDRRARQLMTASTDIRRQLCDLLGSDAYLADGQLNRRLIADYLFGSRQNAQRINAIVHPVVRHDWQLFAQETASPVLIESAILVEAGLADTVDAIIVVTAPEQLRLQRASMRDNADEQQVRARMDAQMPEPQLLTHADYVIVNDGRPLLPQLDGLMQALSATSRLPNHT